MRLPAAAHRLKTAGCYHEILYKGGRDSGQQGQQRSRGKRSRHAGTSSRSSAGPSQAGGSSVTSAPIAAPIATAG